MPHHTQLLEPQARRRPSFVPQSPLHKPNEDSTQVKNAGVLVITSRNPIISVLFSAFTKIKVI
jgi:hypothetical protein